MYTIEQTNKELKKVIDYLEEINDVYNEPMNLKLHDVNYYCYKDMKEDFPLCYKNNKDDYFSFFCEDSYEMFLEWCYEENIDFEKMMARVDRTSNFYLTNIHDVSIEYILYNLLDNVYGGYYGCIYAKGSINILDNNLEDVQDELEYICTDFYNDVKEYFEDAIKVYDYIKDFKENQIEYFKDFLSIYEEDLKYKEEEENKCMNEFNNNIESIIEDLKNANVEYLNKKIDFLNNLKKQ